MTTEVEEAVKKAQEYGYDIAGMRAFQDAGLSVEIPMENLSRTQLETILGGVPIIRCRDCLRFELDHWDVTADGIPLITAHEICTFWGRGCKTSPDGFCYMAERMEKGAGL